jgi:hypothetical protein
MDFGQAFTFVFDDEDWIKKIGIGGLLSLIPIIGWFLVLGWGVEITKRVINKDAEVLPDWDDFGGYLTRGFLAFVVAFVYTLPITILSGCGGGLTVFADTYDEDFLRNAVWVVTSCLSCLSFIYGIVAYLILPAAIANYAVTNELGEAFKLGEIYAMVRDNLGTYGMVLLGGIVAGLVSGLGLIACVIGVLFTAVYAMAINGHLWGQAYSVSKSDSPAEPVPAAD